MKNSHCRDISGVLWTSSRYSPIISHEERVVRRQQMRWNNSDWYGNKTGIIESILNLVFFLNLLALLGLTLILVMRGLGRGGSRSPYAGTETDPLALAKLRLAAGEITEEEFEEIHERLQG